MAKKSMLQREKKRIELSGLMRERRNKLRNMRNDKSISFDERLTAQRILNSLSRDSSASRVRNRCFITGRPRGYYRMFGMSRIQLRLLANWGLMPGVKKASW